MDTPLPTPLLLGLWLLALLAVRVAWVVVHRERVRHAAVAEAGEVLDDGTGSVRVAAIVVAVLVTAYALLGTWDKATAPLVDGEMLQLVNDVVDSFSEEGLDGAPSTPTVSDVEDAVEDAGHDRDDVVVRQAASGWRETESYEGTRFQLTNADGAEPRCLQIIWFEDGTPGNYRIDAGVAGEIC